MKTAEIQDKKRLFRILAGATADEVAGLAENIRNTYTVTMIKEPAKTLAMIKLREPVKNSLFYIGEMIASEAVVMIDGTKGMAVTMGDDFGKVLNMAIIDAACNSGTFTGTKRLLELEEQQKIRIEKENAMHLNTQVSFHAMDTESLESPPHIRSAEDKEGSS